MLRHADHQRRGPHPDYESQARRERITVDFTRLATVGIDLNSTCPECLYPTTFGMTTHKTSPQSRPVAKSARGNHGHIEKTVVGNRRRKQGDSSREPPHVGYEDRAHLTDERFPPVQAQLRRKLRLTEMPEARRDVGGPTYPVLD